MTTPTLEYAQHTVTQAIKGELVKEALRLEAMFPGVPAEWPSQALYLAMLAYATEVAKREAPG